MSRKSNAEGRHIILSYASIDKDEVHQRLSSYSGESRGSSMQLELLRRLFLICISPCIAYFILLLESSRFGADLTLTL